MDRFLYTGARTKEISFPLGGIGTGCIGLAGNGRLIDWEIFNRPNKGGMNGFSHFAIKAEAGGKVLDARVLNGDLLPPYSGEIGAGSGGNFGFGVPREYLTGLPHFREVEFRGEFPIALLTFKEPRFPGRVRMTAFNPFIPLDADDSGIPAAFFEIEIKNMTKRRITYTLCGTLCNPLPTHNLNRLSRRGNVTALRLSSDGAKLDDVGYGDMTLATDALQTSHQEYWFQSSPLWFNDLGVFWRDFTTPGRLRNRRYAPGKSGQRTHGTIAAHVTLAPGKSATIRFIISWNFPNCENYWDRGARERAEKAGVSPTWRNYYATRFADSMASATYGLRNWDRLYSRTLAFKQALFSSDVPPAILDAVSANISILKTPTALRLEDGTFYGWEGCSACAGCCEGSCTHVWNYAQALPFLFPKLERSMREADFRYNQRPDGGMAFRLQLPLGSGRSSFRPCADGGFGGVIKTYRDWKISGDTEWLRSLWPAVKKSIEFAWAKTNEDRWDPRRTGVLHGRQHHTLDMELFGPNSWLTGFYLAALKAGAEMAEHLGERDTARDYRSLFDKGRRWVEAHLFNGEYYHQAIDLRDRALVKRFGAADVYWDAEHGEIAYQIGEGCGIDQMLAQWHANVCGLGDIFEPKRARKALAAIFKHNFKQPMGESYNPCRIYCLNDEAGLVICEWPAGKRKPMAPVPYAQETMHGFEYAAAGHMIQMGLVNEGTRVAEVVRDRYDGERRNPWNEIECGSNYARSMASYALLNAFSGFRFDMTKGLIGFNPVAAKGGRFRCFWSLDSGWGIFEMKRERVALKVLHGSLEVKGLELPFLRGRKVAGVRVGAKKVAAAQRGRTLELARRVRVKAGASLVIEV
jgi:non-lysosomal glucosylceramidase